MCEVAMTRRDGASSSSRRVWNRSLDLLVRGARGGLLEAVGMVLRRGGQRFDPACSTVLVVSHEASVTGAPILALNLCQELGTRYNVIVLLLTGGSLEADFRASATAVIRARRGHVSHRLLRRSLRWASRHTPLAFAVVNSVVSAPVLHPLHCLGIATVGLIHEFALYIKPVELFTETALWASRLICSTPLVWADVLLHCPLLASVPVLVLPQGRCQAPPLPLPDSIQGSHSLPDAIESVLSTPESAPFLLLGAGKIQPRKGVDLFVVVADQIRRMAPDLPIQFVWIGADYDPASDGCVSMWLCDQIRRAGLSDHLTILNESQYYSDLIARADLFLLSSRLDPLPNVAIDAMASATPVLCFAEASGIADLLSQAPDLRQACVAPYLDCTQMASQAVALLRSGQQRRQLGLQLQGRAQQWFDMPRYCRELVRVAQEGASEIEQQRADARIIREQRLIDPGFHDPKPLLSASRRARQYLLAWRQGIAPRKPFPGFHPGIYREQAMPCHSDRDPLAHWYEQGGRPGPWQVPLITPGSAAAPLPPSEEVALHLHAHYPRLLDEILGGLRCNHIRPALYITFSQPEHRDDLHQALQQHGLRGELILVPNRGRDIGPLLTELGRHLDCRYSFYGHMHTKKSVHVCRDYARLWRRFLLSNLLGTAASRMADRILVSLQATPSLGLIFPDDPGCLGWTENHTHAETLARRMDLPPLPEAINFPTGTMFWARRGALSRLYDLRLTWDDYPEEPIGYDGTILHAMERLLPQICLASGYSYAMTHVPGCRR